METNKEEKQVIQDVCDFLEVIALYLKGEHCHEIDAIQREEDENLMYTAVDLHVRLSALIELAVAKSTPPLKATEEDYLEREN